jgi:MSHA pilin protein MshC
MSRWSRQHPSLTRPSGFSLVELIIIIIILGILSAVALPRFFRPADFEARFAVDHLKVAMQYAQKRAVNGGCQTQFELSTTGSETGYTLNSDTICDNSGASSFTTPIKHPTDGGDFIVTLPSEVTITSPPTTITLRFMTNGTVKDAAGILIVDPLSIQIQQGSIPRIIKVFGSTGVIE